MNMEILDGTWLEKWRQLRREAKTQWGKLTDDDLDHVSGNAEKLVGKVQERYGYARGRAEQEVDLWAAGREARRAANL